MNESKLIKCRLDRLELIKLISLSESTLDEKNQAALVLSSINSRYIELLEKRLAEIEYSLQRNAK